MYNLGLKLNLSYLDLIIDQLIIGPVLFLVHNSEIGQPHAILIPDIL